MSHTLMATPTPPHCGHHYTTPPPKPPQYTIPRTYHTTPHPNTLHTPTHIHCASRHAVSKTVLVTLIEEVVIWALDHVA